MRTQKARQEKLVDGELRVHAWTPQGFLSAGLLQLEEDGDAISATFTYDASYLESRLSYPLDPLNMPLGRGRLATDSQFVTLGAIFDAAPDAWGRRVVSAQLPAEARQRVFRNAFLRGADGIGSLVLTPEIISGDIELDRIVAISLAERPGLSQLERAAQAARELEQGAELTDEMRSMLGGSWTIGGARPKAILRDDSSGAIAGQSVIAKFDALSEAVPRNRIEAACLDMAVDMGFRVPAHRLVELPGGHTALLLERFDRPVIENRVHRLHYLSAMSLASHQPQSKFLNSTMDRAVLSWSKMLEIASRICVKPQNARAEMFARLALNVALQNTDDHLKNFAFLKLPGSAMHYDIAPVFDVSAQGAQRHYLHCLDMGQIYTLTDVIPRARELGIARASAQEVESRIADVLTGIDKYLDDAGLARADADKVRAWVSEGLGPRYREHVLGKASVQRAQVSG